MNWTFSKTGVFVLSDGEEIMILASFVLIQYQIVTGRQISLLWPYQCLLCYQTDKNTAGDLQI